MISPRDLADGLAAGRYETARRIGLGLIPNGIVAGQIDEKPFRHDIAGNLRLSLP